MRARFQERTLSLNSWANLATVWLAFLCFIGLLIPLAVAFFAVRGMHVAVDRTPALFKRAQGYSGAMRRKVDYSSRVVADRVVTVRTSPTRVRTRFERLFGKTRRTDNPGGSQQ